MEFPTAKEVKAIVDVNMNNPLDKLLADIAVAIKGAAQSGQYGTSIKLAAQVDIEPVKEFLEKQGYNCWQQTELLYTHLFISWRFPNWKDEEPV